VFWSGNKLQKELDTGSSKDSLVYYSNNPGKKPEVDCASIVLSVGPEGYITSQKQGIKVLDDNDKSLLIPKGQFGFILTEEYIKVPHTAMAFISFKAGYKFQGLINVSGFHVDPGWHGRLIFSVYNAGPKDVTLHHGDPFALVWFADLDDSATDKFSKKSAPCKLHGISSDIVNKITGDVFSPITLKNDFDSLKKDTSDQTRKIELDIELFKKSSDYKFENELIKLKNEIRTWVLAGILTVVAGLVIYFGRAGLVNNAHDENTNLASKSNSSLITIVKPESILESKADAASLQNALDLSPKDSSTNIINPQLPSSTQGD